METYGTIKISKDVVGNVWMADFHPEGWRAATPFKLAMNGQEVKERLESRNPYHNVITK